MFFMFWQMHGLNPNNETSICAPAISCDAVLGQLPPSLRNDALMIALEKGNCSTGLQNPEEL